MKQKDIIKALTLIISAHAGQTRKGVFQHVPYVQHLFDVHKRTVHYLMTGEDDLELATHVMQAGALMHDLIEDTDVTYEYIASMFGHEVANLVQELSRPDDMGNTRKDKYEWMEGYMEKSLESVIIKIADRYSNVMDYMADEKKQAYASFYALQGYPVYQAYLIYGGSNIRILDDIHAMDEIVRKRYPNVSMFADYADKVVRRIATEKGKHGWK
jgi:(p)ppGpp synthase/HD superfamily hydrolase